LLFHFLHGDGDHPLARLSPQTKNTKTDSEKRDYRRGGVLQDSPGSKKWCGVAMEKLFEELASEAVKELLRAVRGTFFCRSTAERRGEAAAPAGTAPAPPWWGRAPERRGAGGAR
uniref:Uncharacterized protein n=1 Tax=Oryza brachyantha TaxID=4533 RepID=J3NEK3_ORYBR